MKSGTVAVVLEDRSFLFLTDEGFKTLVYRAGTAVQVLGEQKGGGLEVGKGRSSAWIARHKLREATKEEAEDFAIEGAAPTQKKKPQKPAQAPATARPAPETPSDTPKAPEAPQIASYTEGDQMDFLDEFFA